MAQVKLLDIRGKGNDGMYVDRFPRIYAAGIRSKQPDVRLSDCFSDYNIPTAVDKVKNEQFNLLRRTSTNRDVRNAGPFTESSKLINPPVLTKFQTLVEDLKSTVYKSYWNNRVGKKLDFSYCIPPDFDTTNTAFGKSTKSKDNLYDIVLPNKRLSPEMKSKSPGRQIKRTYCNTSFDPNKIYGIKANVDNSGKYVKCCLTYDNIYLGTSQRKPIATAQRNYQEAHTAELETPLTPNNNINNVPEGHTFGKKEPKDNNNVHGCLTYCEVNPEREILYECLAHLNTLRKCLRKKFDGPFFRDFYLQLKCFDKSSCGWLSKELIYELCTRKFIRFTPNLIEPLLKLWGAINGKDIEYKTFVNVINFREPLPDLPKVQDIPPKCADFRTTYKEMVKPQEPNNLGRAGIPSGRYFDRDYPVTPKGCCKADRSYLPEESDAKTCLIPSTFTLLGVSHRDMYAKQTPENVKRVFKAAGEDINDHEFDEIWDHATKFHPQGLVSYETFRCALKEYKNKVDDSRVKNM